MVTQVTPEIREAIDGYLDGLARKWDEALDIIAQWDELDPLDQDVFDAEWPLTIDYLNRLRDYRQQGMFSTIQERWFQKLQRDMYGHEPDL
ncbi:MAG: hypothetical protein H0V47_07280, partial [Chloroflexia bacterium]|nr:hypothetical protein [Chloroflexia bacterium]